MMPSSWRRKARRIFLATHLPPWRCVRCDRLVHKLGRLAHEGHVHHVDEDITNTEPPNLELFCASCHHSMHNRNPSVEIRAKMSAAHRGRKHTPEARGNMLTAARANREKKSRSHRGVPLSDAHRAAISAGLKGHK